MIYLEPKNPQPTSLAVDLVLMKLNQGQTHQQIKQCCAECRAALRAILTQPELRKRLPKLGGHVG